MTFARTIVAGAAGVALFTAPLFALAQDDDNKKSKMTKAFDETAVSISISDNGSVLVRGAEVTDVSGDRITAVTEVGSLDLVWRIDTNGDTDFVDEDGAGIESDDVSDGDYVSFSGSLDTDGEVFTVDADTVRDWSVDSDDDDDRPIFRFWTDFKTKFPGWSFWGHAKGDNR